ncbi:MAG: hypothetical protein PHX62_05525 [Bacilli bacterium]|nr:hypothetical protein [Bacilli bacterium]
MANEEGNPISKEKRIVKVEYLLIDDFLKECSYDNVIAIVLEAKRHLKV